MQEIISQIRDKLRLGKKSEKDSNQGMSAKRHFEDRLASHQQQSEKERQELAKTFSEQTANQLAGQLLGLLKEYQIQKGQDKLPEGIELNDDSHSVSVNRQIFDGGLHGAYEYVRISFFSDKGDPDKYSVLVTHNLYAPQGIKRQAMVSIESSVTKPKADNRGVQSFGQRKYQVSAAKDETNEKRDGWPSGLNSVENPATDEELIQKVHDILRYFSPNQESWLAYYTDKIKRERSFSD